MEDFAEFGRAEKDGWSEPGTAKSYADEFGLASEQCVPQLVATCGAGPGMRALDVCCGQGIVAEGLVAAGAQVTGLDFSPAMLALACQRVPQATFIEGDATALPFADNHFQAASMGFGILHIPDSAAALAEVRRVLEPGSRFSYSVWQPPEMSDVFRIVFGAIAEHGDPSVTLPPGPALHAYADPDYAFAALEEAGFSDPAIETADSAWTVDDPAKPFDCFISGSVRGALLLRAQPDANKAAIRKAIAEAVIRDLGETGPWRIGMPAAIVSAVA